MTLTSESAMPRHVAFIPDGNRRWSSVHGTDIKSGHEEGFERINEIVYRAKELGIEYFTTYVFSTENWNRSATEVEQLLNLVECVINKHAEVYSRDGIRVRIIGDLSRFSERLQKLLNYVQEQTKHCDELNLTLCLNYGSRSEIVRACKNIAKDVLSGDILPELIGDDTFNHYLYTNGMPDPDLVIRTSGESRISNFMLWQLAYSEFVFEGKLLPDYTADDFCNSLDTYSKRIRRFGT